MGTGIEKERRIATVTGVHEYGLDIDIDGRPGFVQPVEIDWTGSKQPTDFVIGEAIEVVVYAEAPDRCYASIKQTLPDPWADAARFGVGTRHRGVVGKVVDWGLSVAIEPGVTAMVICSHEALAHTRGDAIGVEVVAIDSRLRKLEVKRVASLLEVLRSGRIGLCVVGAPAAGVIAWLGDDEGIAGNRRGTTRGLAFLGRFLQVGSHEERITHFGLYFRYLDAKTDLELLGIDRPTSWTRATTRADVESALTESGLVWRERRKDLGPALELDSGADIIFDDADGSLDSIQVAKRR